MSLRDPDTAPAELKELAQRPATEMKRWREVVGQLARGDLLITNHGAGQAVVLSVERYLELVRSAHSGDPLETLRLQFDSRLSSLDRPDASARLLSAADAPADEIGKMAEPALFAG